jgi:hypothetical protein
MAKAIYDGADQALLVPSGTITVSTTFPGIRCSPTLMSTSMWCLAVSAIAAAGTYTFALEAAPTVGGSYVEIGRVDWPSGESAPRQIQLGVAASAAQLMSASAQFLRVRTVLAGGAPSCTFSAWLGKPSGAPGLFARGGNTVSV